MEILLLIITFVIGLLIGGFLTWSLMRTSNLKNSQSLIEENNLLKQQTQWISNAENKLRETFEALSSKALKENAEQLTREAKSQLEGVAKQLEGDLKTQDANIKGVLNPVKENLEKLKLELNAIETKREGAYKGLHVEVGQLHDAYKELQTVTANLNSALRSSQTRGKWGELQLRRIVEIAGMIDQIDFEEQTGAESRPDMIVHLPNEAILPVDAKAPMNAYLDAAESTSQEAADIKLTEHAKALRNHMKSLSKKEYWSQFTRAPEFVVMLVPYDPGITAAFIKDPQLFEDALSSKVLIVSPASLLALLKVIAYGWVQIKLAENAQRIADQGKELYSRLLTFSKHLGDVGSRLEQTVKCYNSAVGSLETRVFPSIRKLREMGAGSEDIEVPSHIEAQSRLISSQDDDLSK
ncbi:MAG: DNA recombination protein RmuC [Spirochaetes bacterium]|nr:DNA recombination protein RmuC [Spirochaetota bacterium]